MEQRSDYKSLVRESERMRRELSKLKVKVEEKRKENRLLLTDIGDVMDRSTRESRIHRGTLDIGRDLTKQTYQKYVAEVPYRAQNNSSMRGNSGCVTGSLPPSIPSFRCTSRSCQARADLEACQARLAGMCRENSHLCQLLAHARSQHLEFPQVNRSRDDVYRPRMFTTEGRPFGRDPNLSRYTSPRPQDFKAYQKF